MIIWPTECIGFIWGVLLLEYKDKFVEIIHDRWLMKMIVLFVAATVFGLSYLKLKPVAFFGDYLLKIVLGIAIIIFMLASNVKLSYGNKVSMFLGKISFEIYLIHGPIMYILKGLYPKLLSGVFILLTITLTVLCSFVLHLVALQFVKWVKLLPFMKNAK